MELIGCGSMNFMFGKRNFIVYVRHQKLSVFLTQKTICVIRFFKEKLRHFGMKLS